MPTLSHSVTYQGYRCHEAMYRRSEGTAPEYGYVVLNLADVGPLVINSKPVPWRNSSNNQEMPAQIDLVRADNMKLFSDQTITAQPAIPKQAGLNLFGDLVLQTYVSGGALPPMTYKDVYIGHSGVEEITERLASAVLHKEGMIKVPVTDIRQFYREYGLLFQNINCRLRSGRYDPRTVDPSGTPWAIQKVLRFLFMLLPGSPRISGDITTSSAGPPADIIGDGEPAIDHIEKLLESYGLVAHFQPDGSFALMNKFSQKVGPGQIPSALGTAAAGKYPITQKKTVSYCKRPPLICVKGGNRVARYTAAYVPIIQFTDGKYYSLYDIAKLMNGYTINQVNYQVLNGEGKNFHDVYAYAPTGVIGEAWVTLLRKWAYKGYAPAFILKPGTPTGGQGPQPTPTAGGATTTLAVPPQVQPGGIGPINTNTAQNPQSGTLTQCSDEDFDFIPFLPATDCPWYQTDLAMLMSQGLIVGQPKSSDGDRGDIILLPPIVWARGIGERSFADVKEMSKYFNRLISSVSDDIQFLQTAYDFASNRAANFSQIIYKAQDYMNKERTNVFGQTITQTGRITVDIDADVRIAAQAYNKNVITSSKMIANQMDSSPQAIANFKAANKEAQEIQTKLTTANNALAALQAQVANYLSVFGTYKKIDGRGNIPTAIIPHGKYSLNNRTGILLFSEPMCWGRIAFSPTSEDNIVDYDGAVMVTYGYELHNNSIEDKTVVYVAAQPGSNPGVPEVVGMGRPAAICAKLERLPKMRLFIDEKGVPMNMTDVKKAAIQAAGNQVAIPDTQVGYEDVYAYLAAAVLDAGISSVVHSYDGKRARTRVFNNSPGAIGPMGPVGTPTVGIADTRAKLAARLSEMTER